jgi:hypothetical protein
MDRWSEFVALKATNQNAGAKWTPECMNIEGWRRESGYYSRCGEDFCGVEKGKIRCSVVVSSRVGGNGMLRCEYGMCGNVLYMQVGYAGSGREDRSLM